MFRKTVKELGELAKRRTKFEIMAEILRIAKNGTIKTRIVYKANLNFVILRQYMRELERNGLIEKSANDGGIIRTTEKGMQYLKRYDEFRHFLNGVDPRMHGDSLRLMRGN